MSKSIWFRVEFDDGCAMNTYGSDEHDAKNRALTHHEGKIVLVTTI